MPKIIYPESRLAHHYLDGLLGLEIGASAHNPFGLATKNVDIADTFNKTLYKQHEVEVAGEMAQIDVVAPGDALPFPDGSQNFVLSSHVLEHFADLIKTLREWYRVVRPGGYVFMIVPRSERTYDRWKKRTMFEELCRRHEGKQTPLVDRKTGHYNFWITEDVIELVTSIGLDWSLLDFQDVDDKIGNGFTLVLRKGPLSEGEKKKVNEKLELLRIKRARIESSLFRPGTVLGRIVELSCNAWREVRRSGIVGLWKRVIDFIRNKKI